MQETEIKIATRDELKAMSRDQLFVSTRKAVNQEKAAVTNVTRHFQEIYDRKMYLPKYASLFVMLKEEDGYCNGSAQLRWSSICLMKDVPVVQEKMESGEISMSVAASIQSFLYQEKIAHRPYSQNAKIELIDACVGKSKLEAQKEFARRNPEIETRDIVRYTSSDRVRIDTSISEAAFKKLNEIRDNLAHVKPNMTLGELIERLADDGEQKYSPRKKAERAAKRTEKKVRDFQAKQKLVHPDELTERADKTMNQADELSKQLDESTKQADKLPKQADKLPKQADDLTELTAKVAKRPDEPSEKPDKLTEPSHKMSNWKTPLKSRYVAAKQKHQVPDDGNGCVHVDPSSGHRCGSKKFLQLDHIKPFAEGGKNVASNLRWMCSAHNRWRHEARAN